MQYFVEITSLYNMPRDGKHQSLKTRIAQLQDSIRRKYRTFKLGNVYNEQILEKQYKPILNELRKQKEFDIKMEPKQEPMETDEFIPEHVSTPKKVNFIRDSDVYGDELPTVSQVIQSPTTLKEASQYVLETFNAPITQKYMLKFMKGEAGANNKMDNIYGPRIYNDKLMVGDQALTFDDGGNIHLNNIQYKGSEGLYELLFKRQPDETLYTKDDLIAYKDILIKSNAHKKGYLHSNPINRPANSIKYKTIIYELFPKQVYGRGLKNLTSRDITYWDDPNELCARLKLIVASTEVGNNSHINEIQNIIEELREAKLISGSGNKRYKLLVGNLNKYQ